MAGKNRPIRLNVGGHMFTTTKETLTKDSGSLLDDMFNSKQTVQYEEDGSVFIDRDGKHFGYILNYLRSDFGLQGGVILPQTVPELEELRSEAMYFQMVSLVGIITDALGKKRENQKQLPVCRILSMVIIAISVSVLIVRRA